jgi:phospholipid/cholesterol/gamma-HCH transport system substrate-binding protein
METRANYLLVGTFVIVLFLGLLGFVLWLSKYGSERQMTQYDIRFEGSVAGLRDGSSVTYRGVTVGEVRDVRIDPENVELILVTVDVAAGTPIKTDTIATLRLNPLTGAATVTLSGGTAEAPDLTAEPGEPRPQIASRPSEIERLMAGAPALIERIDGLVGQFSGLVTPENVAAFTATLANLEKMSDTLAQQSPNLALVIEDTAKTMASVVAAAGSVARVSGRLEQETEGLGSETVAAMRAVNRAAATADETLGTMDRAGRQIEALVAENRAPINDMTSTLAYDTVSVLVDLRELVVSLNRMTTELSRDPARFLFGGQQRGFETR